MFTAKLFLVSLLLSSTFAAESPCRRRRVGAPSTTARATFKKGDRVRALVNFPGQFKEGDSGMIVGDAEFPFGNAEFSIDWDNGSKTLTLPSDIELVAECKACNFERKNRGAAHRHQHTCESSDPWARPPASARPPVPRSTPSPSTAQHIGTWECKINEMENGMPSTRKSKTIGLTLEEFTGTFTGDLEGSIHNLKVDDGMIKFEWRNTHGQGGSGQWELTDSGTKLTGTYEIELDGWTKSATRAGTRVGTTYSWNGQRKQVPLTTVQTTKTTETNGDRVTEIKYNHQDPTMERIKEQLEGELMAGVRQWPVCGRSAVIAKFEYDVAEAFADMIMGVLESSEEVRAIASDFPIGRSKAECVAWLVESMKARRYAESVVAFREQLDTLKRSGLDHEAAIKAMEGDGLYEPEFSFRFSSRTVTTYTDGSYIDDNCTEDSYIDDSRSVQSCPF